MRYMYSSEVAAEAKISYWSAQLDLGDFSIPVIFPILTQACGGNSPLSE